MKLTNIDYINMFGTQYYFYSNVSAILYLYKPNRYEFVMVSDFRVEEFIFFDISK